MLTDEDRQLGHRIAGDWLVANGETDAVALAVALARLSSHPLSRAIAASREDVISPAIENSTELRGAGIEAVQTASDTKRRAASRASGNLRRRWSDRWRTSKHWLHPESPLAAGAATSARMPP